MGHQVQLFHVHYRSPVIADPGIGGDEVDVLNVMFNLDLEDCIGDAGRRIEA